MNNPTLQQKFLFDVQGFLHLRKALSPEEIEETEAWMEAAQGVDIKILNQEAPEGIKTQMNRPVSRIIDADPRFARYLDHPATAAFLNEFLGEDYRHIDNDLYYTVPGYAGGHWHRGVRTRLNGNFQDGHFVCPMVKIFFCISDVGPGEGEFALVPGSHKTRIDIPMADPGMDLPGQHVFDDVKTGDIIIFDEALLHTGRPNQSGKTRRTLIMNFGRADAGPWPGYRPKEETLLRVSAGQRKILTNVSDEWMDPTPC